MVRAIRDKGNEEWDVVTEDVGHAFNDSVQLLMFVKCITQVRFDRDHVVDVPKHLFYEVCSMVFRD